MEQLIWTILGYIAMPMFFVVGFAVTAVVACLIMDVLEIPSLSNRDRSLER